MSRETKSNGKKDELDRFYTSSKEAERLVDAFLSSRSLPGQIVFLEPSAGDGAFVSALEHAGKKHVVALDIAPSDEPLCDSIIMRHDFLRDDPSFLLNFATARAGIDASRENVVVIGNPPFGEQGKTAIEFVNSALSFARFVAFILPPSFRKESVQAKLNGAVVDVFDVVDQSYRVGKGEISVPSAFFVIDGDERFEPVEDPSDLLPFEKIPSARREDADFAIQRVGGNAGMAKENDASLSDQTHYFYVMGADCPDDIVDIVNTCEFPEREWSVGPRSLSSKEIAVRVHEKMVELGLIPR